ncbi:MAG: choline dehydrogenase [Rhodospirillales bacterium]|nr:choline dehydrogenase [Rhodospirillales bacterium]
MAETNFDFIIVGAGSAGCALAEGLSSNGKLQVCVIEAGGSDMNFWIKMPIGYGRTFYNKTVNWMYETEAEPNLDNRKLYWPRGKVLGGSSSINALVYCRGQKNDFKDWASAGAHGWDWDTISACYVSFENPVDSNDNRTGTGGMTIKDIRNEIHKSTHNYYAMAKELGLPVIDDMNGSDPKEGISHYRITTNHGMRNSSATAFLNPAKARSNVTVITKAEVMRIEFDGKRATGIEYRQNGQTHHIKAQREIIVSAGTVNTPKLLQLSGIGPGQVLQDNAITPILVNENVGGNLQDHLGINYYYKASEPTLNTMLSPWWGKLIQGMRYVLTRKGPLSLSVNQCGGFLRSREELDAPDQQFYLNPVSYTTQPEGKRTVINPDPWPGFILSYQPCRPSSRGRIDIASPDPSAAPKIVPNYLSTNKDIEDVIAGGRLVQRMAKTTAIQKFATEATPPDIQNMDDENILTDFRQRSGTVFHPTSTCRMGKDAHTAVVDPHLKVFGVEGLRIADASVFPNVTSGNTNAPALMVGRRAAEIIQA